MGNNTNTILVEQVKSTIGAPEKHKKILLSMGLRGIGKKRSYKDNNCIRGMVNQVSHLVKYTLNPKGEV